MLGKSRKNIHVGINYILAPIPSIDRSSALKFQSQLEGDKIDITNVSYLSNQISMIRQNPGSSLEIKLLNVGPQVVQLVILLSQPEYSIELIEEEVDRIVTIFNNVWPTNGKQLIACDTTIRTLFDSTSNHAFQEIWENRLNQKKEELSILGRPIQGGGLRFVLPPSDPRDPNDYIIEIKIESFLPDPRKIYVESQFIWKIPSVLKTHISGSDKIELVEKFINDNIIQYITRGL
jgi:hypothetical protein